MTNDLLVQSKIKLLISNLFFIDLNEITETTSPETVPNWDSVGQLNLILALEEEFNTTFSTEQVSTMITLQLITLEVLNNLNNE